MADYEALINGLRIAIEPGSDSWIFGVTRSSSSTKS
jgi:hypothetical protein